MEPFTVRAKMLMQSLWRSKLSWDAIIPSDQQLLWKCWMMELPCIKDYSISRRYPRQTHNFIKPLVVANTTNKYFTYVLIKMCTYPLQVQNPISFYNALADVYLWHSYMMPRVTIVTMDIISSLYSLALVNRNVITSSI